MAKLIYGMNVSLDGFMEDASGSIDWAEPSEEVHAFFNDLERPIGTALYGRRLYETMAVWETDPSLASQSEVTADYARVWRDTDKIVYSTTLDSAATARTRIERTFDAEAIRRLKAAAGRDLTVGGAELAGHAFRAGLVDELYLMVAPVSLGRGKRALADDLRLGLELIDHTRFANGSVYLRYRVSG